MTNQTYPSGASISYVRDQLGRVTSSTEYTANGSVARTETTSYDALGRVSAVEDANYRQEYDWDNLGRLLARRTGFKGQGITNELDYRYGEYGDLVSEQGSDGYSIQYFWDDADNLTSVLITPPKGTGVVAQQLIIEFDAVGRAVRSRLVSGSNVVAGAALKRDEKGRLTQVSYSGYGTSLTALPTVGYSYDARDLVTNILDYAKGLSGTLGYDPRGYLNSETWSQLSDGTQIYQDKIGYDDAGNRVWRQAQRQSHHL